MKSEVAIRPIWHRRAHRVQAHIMTAFLAYCLWTHLRQTARRFAPTLTPWAILDQLRHIQLIDVWFQTRDGRRLHLPRITQPTPEQKLLIAQLGWRLPEQPPPRIYASQAQALKARKEVPETMPAG
jgi:hypothetical protein